MDIQYTYLYGAGVVYKITISSHTLQQQERASVLYVYIYEYEYSLHSTVGRYYVECIEDWIHKGVQEKLNISIMYARIIYLLMLPIGKCQQ